MDYGLEQTIRGTKDGDFPLEWVDFTKKEI